MANRKSSSVKPASAAWRILLVMFGVVYLKALEFMDIRIFNFIWRWQDIDKSGLTLNFVFAGISALGLLLMLFASPSNRYLVGAGFVLLLLPVWSDGALNTSQDITQVCVIHSIEPDVLKLICTLPPVLLGMCVIRGGSSLTKFLLALLYMGEMVLLCVLEAPPIDWYNVLAVTMFSMAAGFAADWSYSGASAGSLICVLVVILEYVLLIMYSMGRTALLVTAGAAGVGILVLLLTKEIKKQPQGAIAALLGLGVNALAVLYMNGLLF